MGAPSEAFSADVPAGDVISQDPAAGHQRGRRLDRRLRREPGRRDRRRARPRPVPPPRPRQALAEARLVGAPSEAFSADVPAGDVISQAPAPGTSVAVGSTVDYVVSLGVETDRRARPGRSRRRRPRQALAEARLVGAPSEAFSADVPAGDVISQDPAPGTSVAVGSTVDYVVSLGVETDRRARPGRSRRRGRAGPRRGPPRGRSQRGLQRRRARRRRHQPGSRAGTSVAVGCDRRLRRQPGRRDRRRARPGRPRRRGRGRPSPRPASWALPARPSAPTCPPATSSARIPQPAPAWPSAATVDYVVSLGVETTRRARPGRSRRRGRGRPSPRPASWALPARPSAPTCPPATSSARLPRRAPAWPSAATVDYVVSLGVTPTVPRSGRARVSRGRCHHDHRGRRSRRRRDHRADQRDSRRGDAIKTAPAADDGARRSARPVDLYVSTRQRASPSCPRSRASPRPTPTPPSRPPASSWRPPSRRPTPPSPPARPSRPIPPRAPRCRPARPSPSPSARVPSRSACPPSWASCSPTPRPPSRPPS